MIDLSFIGENGMIIQYEDIISMIGYNVASYLKEKNMNDKLNKISKEDIMLSYINRTDEDVDKWLLNNFDIEFNIQDYTESKAALKPNLMYAYRIFSTAYKNGIKKLIIHSEFKSDIIKEIIDKTFDVPVEYTYGDIVPVLKNNVNSTYMTSCLRNIKKCLDINIPIALTIVDDYMYVGDIIINKIDEKLREKNIFVCYSGIFSGGFIK